MDLFVATIAGPLYEVFLAPFVYLWRITHPSKRLRELNAKASHCKNDGDFVQLLADEAVFSFHEMGDLREIEGHSLAFEVSIYMASHNRQYALPDRVWNASLFWVYLNGNAMAHFWYVVRCGVYASVADGLWRQSSSGIVSAK